MKRQQSRRKYMRKQQAKKSIRFGLGLILGIFLMYGWVGPASASEHRGVPEYYPEKFDGIGRIDRLGEDQIIIDDGTKRLASGVSFATPSSQYAGREPFRVGTTVGYVLNRSGEIQSLWLLKPAH
jgi:hypothetical protein